MDSGLLLSIATFAYALAVACYVAGFAFKFPPAGKAGTAVTGAAALVNLAGIIMRWVESHRLGIGHAPLSNLYESLVFFAFAIGLVYLIMERKFRTRAFGAVAVLPAFIALAYASLSPDMDQQIKPLIPALQSNWLTAHVISCFLGYAAFAVAFGISLLYIVLAKNREPRGDEPAAGSLIPPADVLDDLIYQTVIFGFFFLSIGIITGAVWANTAWGRYWGWDPKETWSLITWFIYATLLHARLIRGWQGKTIAWISVAGFAAVIFTYFGVNLLPGLHSYQ
ncbi:MAG: c-type cytochrome biogenesis protein CcsB [Thermodesulfobacteriota bacterium]